MQGLEKILLNFVLGVIKIMIVIKFFSSMDTYIHDETFLLKSQSFNKQHWV